MWVTRIEVPDEQGRLHNLLEEPQWMDTVSIPRNGGRVVCAPDGAAQSAMPKKQAITTFNRSIVPFRMPIMAPP